MEQAETISLRTLTFDLMNIFLRYGAVSFSHYARRYTPRFPSL